LVQHENQYLESRVSAVMMNRWQGHLPAASAALSTLLQPAGCGGAQFTAAERALFTACEFWVAVQTRTLGTYLGPLGADPMRYLSIVYAAMGAPDLARLLIAGIGGMREAATAAERLKYLAALQEHMARTQEPVDQLIAELAQSLGLSSAPSPETSEESWHATRNQPSLSWSRRGTSQAWWANSP
jgi:hypothetical protein